MPAIIILPSEDEYNHYLDMKLEPVFGIGERLCPYCLIKRLMSINEILKPVIDELLGRILEEPLELRFPSVTDIALTPYKKSFITEAAKIDGVQELVNELAGWVKEIWEKLAEKRIPIMGREPITYIEKKLTKEIKKRDPN